MPGDDFFVCLEEVVISFVFKVEVHSVIFLEGTYFVCCCVYFAGLYGVVM